MSATGGSKGTKVPYRCSFCGKSQEQVRKLIAGQGVYICDECIKLCQEIIEEEMLEAPRSKPTTAKLPNPPQIKAALDLIFGDHFSLNEPGIFVPIRDTLLERGDFFMPDARRPRG